MEKTRRVVITGMGAITPLGNDVQTFLENLIAGKSGVGPITRFDASEYDVKIAAEVKDFDPTCWMTPKKASDLDRFTQFAVVASNMAHQNSGLEITEKNAHRIGVIIGSGVGGVEAWDENSKSLAEKGPSRVSPHFVPKLIANMASGVPAIMLGAEGPSYSVNSACATGSHSIGTGAMHIVQGMADVMFVGGSEAPISPLAIAGFARMKALSTRNDDPTRASRPYDKNRDGFVMGEGAGVLVLEELEHAKNRGATIYAELIGYGCSADADEMVKLNPEGAARSMWMALNSASMKPYNIGYINTHGTSTPNGDIGESMAIKRVFGDFTRTLPISSTKSMHGHLLGAAGAIEAIVCIKAIQEGIIPPTINLENPDPECDLYHVANKIIEAKIKVAMSNSFGFGGQNSTLIFKVYKD